MRQKETLFDIRIDDYPVLPEDTYLEQMETSIGPKLEKMCQTITLKRGKDQLLYCEYYFTTREQSKGSIFVSHGFTESCGKYRELFYYMLREGYNICAVEHRGHGHSRTIGFSDYGKVPTHVDHFRDYVNDMHAVVTEVLTTFLPAPYYLFCHSMGGAIGATYLEQHPGIFEKAVLSSPMMGVNTGNISSSMARFFAGLKKLCGQGKSFMTPNDVFVPKEDFENSCATCKPRYLYYFRQQLTTPEYQNGGCSFNWIREALKAGNELLDAKACANISIPVLLFQAGQDSLVLPQPQDRFVEQIADGHLITVPDSKHEIYLSPNETLAKYLAVIFAFYQGSYPL